MNFEEAIDLLSIVSDFSFKDPAKIPNLSIYDKEKDGFVLYVKADLVTEEYRDFLEGIVESHKLKMRESEGYLILQS